MRPESRVVMLDTAVLVAVTNTLHPNHMDALRVLERALPKGIHLATCGQILRDYAETARRPVESKGLGLEAGHVAENIGWFKRRLVYFEENEAVFSLWLDSCKKDGLAAPQLHNAHIAALAQYYNMDLLVTTALSEFPTMEADACMTPGQFLDWLGSL